MNRVYNFSAGPSTLPIRVLEKAADELTNYKNTGMSVMEMSHRSDDFKILLEETKSLVKELLDISDEYEILFLQGGATTQFSMVPLNIMNKYKKASIVHTGIWTKKAYDEAKKYGDVEIIASSEDRNFNYIPKIQKSDFNKDIDYVHICVNNTIYGTRYKPSNIPETANVPLVADMSSNILSEVYDMSKFDLVFAGAQKNMGPAGMCLVIIKKNLIGNVREQTPIMLDYKIHSINNSSYNTPPCYNIYISKLVYEWLKSNGGVEEMQKMNYEKSNLLYDHIYSSELFYALASKEDRSIMNVVFTTGDAQLDLDFISFAEKSGLVNLKGHKSIGGLRASIYNAMELNGVKKLIECMKKFETNKY